MASAPSTKNMSALRGSQGDVPALSPVGINWDAKTETADLYGTAHLPIRLQVPRLSGNKNEKCKEV